jgi:hypothetical protein
VGAGEVVEMSNPVGGAEDPPPLQAAASAAANPAMARRMGTMSIVRTG